MTQTLIILMHFTYLKNLVRIFTYSTSQCLMWIVAATLDAMAPDPQFLGLLLIVSGTLLTSQRLQFSYVEDGGKVSIS